LDINSVANLAWVGIPKTEQNSRYFEKPTPIGLPKNH